MNSAAYRNLLFRLRGRAKRYRGLYAACVSVRGVSLFLLFSTMGVLLSRVVGQITGEYPSGSLRTIVIYVAAIIVLSVISGTVGIGFTYIEGKVRLSLRRDMLDSYFRAEETAAAEYSPEEFLSRMNGDLNDATGLVGAYLSGWIYEPAISGALSLAWVFWMNPLFGLLCLVCASVNMVFFQAMAKRLVRYTEEAVECRSGIFVFLREYLLGTADIRTLGWQRVFQGRLDSDLKEYQSKNKRLTGTEAGRRAVLTFFADCVSILLLLWAGRYLVDLGYFRFSDVMIAIPLMDQIGQMMIAVVNKNVIISQAGVHLKRVFEIVDLEGEEYGGTGAGTGDDPALRTDEGQIARTCDDHFLRTDEAIRLERISYSYAGKLAAGKQVLSDVSLSIEKGKKTALIGESGSGKSTILNVIAGLYLPDGGDIYIGGRSAGDIPADERLSDFSVLPQKPHLFNCSIAQNIALSETPDMDKVKRCAAMAAASPFIEELPEKYETVIQENNAGLSGGQIQRIALARCLYDDAPIILMDEPTASVDRKSEEEIISAVLSLQDRTVVMVSHRLGCVKDFDNIAVINNGRVTEEGDHQSLMMTGGEYARLWRLQQDAE